MSDEGRILGYSIAGLFFGIFIFFKSFGKYKEKKLIENTPTSKVRSIAMGPVEIYGEVIENKSDLITAPFSRKKVAYCKWTIEEYRKSGKHSKWVTVKRGVIGKYFYLKDKTGSVLVEVKGANVDIPIDNESKRVNDKIKSFLDSQGISYKTWIFNKQMRFREYFLEQGDKVYIFGNAGDNPFVEDGSSDKNEADIMIQKKDRLFYYISDKPEKEVLKSYSLKVYGGMFGGAGLIIVCLFIIFAYLRIL